MSAVETSGEHGDAQLGVGALSIHDVYRPDLAGWRREAVPNRPTGFPIRLVPDWVCEVVSPGNAQHDLTLKRRAYHAA